MFSSCCQYYISMYITSVFHSERIFFAQSSVNFSREYQWKQIFFPKLKLKIASQTHAYARNKIKKYLWFQGTQIFQNYDKAKETSKWLKNIICRPAELNEILF